jgi:hypothetical protein
MGAQMVEENMTQGEFSPGLTSPSIFQHIKPIGRDGGIETGRFLRAKHRS